MAQGLQRLHQDVRRTPKFILDCIVLLIAGHGLTLVAGFLFKVAPKWSLQEADWFWSPFFKMKLTHEWWLTYLGEYCMKIIIFYVMAKIAAKYSDTLFIVCLIFFGYHIIDFLMFMWSYGNQFYIYLDLSYTGFVLIKYAIVPYPSEKLARIKSLF